MRKMRVWWKSGNNAKNYKVKTIEDARKKISKLQKTERFDDIGLGVFKEGIWEEWYCINCYENVFNCDCFR